MVLNSISRGFTKVFGSRNDRLIKRYHRRVGRINALEPEICELTDAQLRERTEQFRERLRGGESPAAVIPEALAVGREVMDRAVGIRNILDPEQGFDPSVLPESARPVYNLVRRQADEMEPAPVKGGEPIPGWLQVEIPNELYEAVRAVYPKSRPPFRARPFDVQLIGGMVLSEGRIAEMKTGEGKTIVAPLACFLASLEDLKCHVVTVNDYLVQRDRDWVFPFYHWLGLTVGPIHPVHTQPPHLKQEAYDCDVVYGTNSEFGFDFLRDNMKLSVEEQVQKIRDFVIIDEVDSILIDEARTPLIISGPAHEDAPRYDLANKVAAHLIQKQRDWDAANDKVVKMQMRIQGLEGDIRNARDKSKNAERREEIKQLQAKLPELEAERDQYTQYYEVEPEKKAAHLTHEGVAEAQRVAGIGSFYVGANMDFPHLLENALRAHAIYQRDKDYVVQDGEVVIVDEFTGRLMVGRQWSDGLHQAVEVKEGVKIKQETQTMATVTIQNFAKLYKRRAGMTGTAVTEATEFNEIYKLDVVCVPTNVPVIREDRNDLIFLSAKDKWDAIIDEIKTVHDVGRPVLVGTTSVEKSEMLSDRLTKKYGIRHSVLNAKQHEREAHIIEEAGALGAVVIATNMAGRGTDIKLRSIEREAVVRHWQLRNLLPKQASAQMSDEQLVSLAYRHQATQQLGLKPQDAQQQPAEALREMLMRHWAKENTWHEPARIDAMDAAALERALDDVPNFNRHRLEIWSHVEQMGGLHIVGTERHESRRIDNQLRGRAGRQGDQGSSRFFISLEDDLMKMFAGNATMSALSKLGMKEGDAIEHRWITRSVERAQRKVEERNYQIRKNLLDYDEVMEYQRNSFYGTRQEVLEGRDIRELIFRYIRGAVTDAAQTYLDRDYVPTQLAEWCRQTLEVSVDPVKLRETDAEELAETIRKEAKAEAGQLVDVTLGEYMSLDSSADDWDLKGLSQWAMSRFSVDLKQNQLREMNPDEVSRMLVEAAHDQIERKDLSGMSKFLEPLYGEKQLAAWCNQKFEVEFDPQTFSRDEGVKLEEHVEQTVERIVDRAREVYEQRELTYPVDFVLDMAFAAAQQDGAWAAQRLCDWAKKRYELDWDPESVVKRTRQELREEMVAAAEPWVKGDRIERLVDEALAEHEDRESLAQWASDRFERTVSESDDLSRESLIEMGRAFYRAQLTQLERYVLLQILDQAWKDHLYAMDQLRDSVGLRGYAERDPRIEYKREGATLFAQMQEVVQDRVTELIFRARLTPNVQTRDVYEQAEASHETASGALGSGRPAPSAQQQAEQEAANRAGGEPDPSEDPRLSRRQRRARAAAAGGGGGGGGASGGGTKRRRRKRR